MVFSASSSVEFRSPPAYMPGEVDIEAFREFRRKVGFEVPEEEEPISSEEYQAAMMVFALMRSLDQKWGFVNQETLNEKMRTMTESSYDANLSCINFSILDQIDETDTYLSHFTNSLNNEKFSNNRIFIIGTGQGRDLIRLTMQGFQVDAIDRSSEMVRSAQAWANRDSQILHGDINSLSPDFPKAHFAGILNESAAEHSNKDQVSVQLRKYADWLVDDGTLLLRLRTSPTGHVFWTYDGVGLRYFTSWTVEEIDQLLAVHASHFTLRERWHNPHREADRPGFEALLLQRNLRIREGVTA